jgi:hypothetical protein
LLIVVEQTHCGYAVISESDPNRTLASRPTARLFDEDVSQARRAIKRRHHADYAFAKLLGASSAALHLPFALTKSPILDLG